MQKRAIETRSKILEAATRIFARKGLSGATVDDIAGEAAVNKQRLYAYFGSKKSLFEAVLLDVFGRVELFSRSTVRKAEAEPAHLTRILLRGFLDVHAAHPYFWRLLSWANLEGPDCVSVLDSVRKNENEALRGIFDRAVAEGLLKPIGFDTYLFSLLAISYFCFSNRLSIERTLALNMENKSWENRLCDDLNGVFQK